MSHENMLPITVKITKIIDENPSVKTFYFDYNLKSQPGQFVMLWIAGVDQKPFSISSDDSKTFGLTVFKRGPLTEKLFELNLGDRVGITGPFGTCYSVLPNRHYIMVAGGYGAAPLCNLAERLVTTCHPERSPRGTDEGSPSVNRTEIPLRQLTDRNDNCANIDFIVGARNKDLLLFENQLKKIPNLKLHITTDDGSAGRKGRVTDVLEELLNPDIHPDNSRKPLVVTCGPEMMEKAVLDLCNQYNSDCELSIERHMKCGFGVCGQCVVDDLGLCMCVDGPVVNRALANQIFELGKYHRDKTGKMIRF